MEVIKKAKNIICGIKNGNNNNIDKTSIEKNLDAIGVQYENNDFNRLGK